MRAIRLSALCSTLLAVGVQSTAFCNRSSWYVDHPCKAEGTDVCCDFQCKFCGPLDYCVEKFHHNSGKCNPRPHYFGPRLCQNYFQKCEEPPNTPSKWTTPTFTTTWRTTPAGGGYSRYMNQYMNPWQAKQTQKVRSSGDEHHPWCAWPRFGQDKVSQNEALDVCARGLCFTLGWENGRMQSAAVSTLVRHGHNLIVGRHGSSLGKHSQMSSAKIVAECSGSFRGEGSGSDVARFDVGSYVSVRSDGHLALGWGYEVGLGFLQAMNPGECCRVLTSSSPLSRPSASMLPIKCRRGVQMVPKILAVACDPEGGLEPEEDHTGGGEFIHGAVPSHGHGHSSLGRWQSLMPVGSVDDVTGEEHDPLDSPTDSMAPAAQAVPAVRAQSMRAGVHSLERLEEFLDDTPEAKEMIKNVAHLAYDRVHGWMAEAPKTRRRHRDEDEEEEENEEEEEDDDDDEEEEEEEDGVEHPLYRAPRAGNVTMVRATAGGLDFEYPLWLIGTTAASLLTCTLCTGVTMGVVSSALVNRNFARNPRLRTSLLSEELMQESSAVQGNEMQSRGASGPSGSAEANEDTSLA